jgi:hypothetical protein
MLRPAEFHGRLTRASKRSGGLADGMRHVWGRPDLRAVVLMFFLIGTFGMNFPIYISTMAVSVFHVGATEFGLLTSSMAVGSVTGALLAAGREKPRMMLLMAASLAFGVALTIAAMMPSYRLFAVALFFVGLSTQTFTTTAHSAAQLWSDAFLRGRVGVLLGLRRHSRFVAGSMPFRSALEAIECGWPQAPEGRAAARLRSSSLIIARCAHVSRRPLAQHCFRSPSQRRKELPCFLT